MRFLLGAPFSEPDKQAYRDALWQRAVSLEDRERAVDYQYRILDRQINKAIGTLTYNALLFAALSAWKNDGPPTLPLMIGSVVALVACLPLLYLFRVSWGPAAEFADAYEDFCAACATTFERSILLTMSLLLSAVATGIAIWQVLAARVSSATSGLAVCGGYAAFVLFIALRRHRASK